MKMRMKRFMAMLCLSAFILMSVLSGCSQTKTGTGELQNQYSDRQEESPEEIKEQAPETSEDEDMDMGMLGGRKFLIAQEESEQLPEFTPSVAPYQTETDLSNIENADRFYLQDQMVEKLAKNNFVVVDSRGSEFFDCYESNRYGQIPNFVTVDSIMHTYHLYFAMLQKNTEKEYLSAAIEDMSTEMQKNSMEQYEVLKGSEWENAAKINVAFFTVGASLMEDDTEAPDYVSDIVSEELKQVYAAADIVKSTLNGELEDYTQYKPRGYYDGDEELEKYFRAMMWYGRCNFAQKDETMDRCALLMTLALKGEAFNNWEKVYSITSFFAGASDDSGTYEYLPLIQEAYGTSVTVEQLAGDNEAFQKFHTLTGELNPPAINSVVFEDDNGKTDKTIEAKGYRFMGQRFTLDAAIFTQLCYSKVKENPNGDKRALPDSLDVPAAMGSDEALSILEDNGNFEYAGYTENMEKVRAQIEGASGSLWTASLYGQWMGTLRPVLEEKGEGYPSFMTNTQWTRKNLETFLSSFTELKHDTVLYSKQFVAEMGGGDETYDDRGYVEPEVLVYARLSNLTTNTAAGLEGFGILDEDDKENLNRLSELAAQLKEISVKELTGAEVTETDYELIRSYGGNLEHFWAEAIKDQNDNKFVSSSEFPSALVVDVATDPNGLVLEQATGGVSTIYVVVPLDGKLRITKGAVFSYYQFVQPIDQRMTDSEWRRKLGLELNDNMEYVSDESLTQPEWTQSYRTQWVYNEN